MKKLFRIVQLIALIVAFVEIIAFGLFLTFYIIDTDFQVLVNEEIIGYIAIGIIVINLIAHFTFLIIIAHNNQKNILRTEDVIGSEVNQIYNYAGIGFLVLDKNNKVIWSSELFDKREIYIIGQDVYEWCMDLSEFQNNEKLEFEKTVVIQDSFFKVRYFKENRMFVFKDITELETTRILFNKNSLAIGIFMIDNYSEIAQNNEDINDIIPMIKTSIQNYGKNFHLVLRSFKNDSFLVLCRNEDLENMRKDNFSLLATIRNIGTKDQIPTSLSIAFACDYPSIYQLNEMASNALSVAIARGGDQAVVAQQDRELTFFGGKTIATENRNKVKVKSDANALLNYIEENKNEKIIILGHKYMDMDCLGACLGVKAICDYKGATNAKFVFDSKLTEIKTRAALFSAFSRDEVEDMTISIKDAENECDNNTLLIIVDVNNPYQMLTSDLLDKTDKVLIIDHHRRGEKFVEQSLLTIIDTSASSACELITELIIYASKFPPIPLDKRFATIMLSGIFLDSGFYKSVTVGVRTFEASMTLKNYGADNMLADDYLKDELEEYSLISNLVQKQKASFTGVVYCTAPNNELIDQATIAKTCDACMRIKSTKCAFVIGRVDEDTIKISARSDGSVNVQLIIEKLGGGGHFTSASATFRNMSVSEVEDKFTEVLNNNYSLAQVNEKGSSYGSNLT